MAEWDVTLLPDEAREIVMPAHSLKEVRRLISRIGKKLRRRANRRSRIQEQMTALQNELATLGDKLAGSEDAELSTLATQVYGYCNVHQKELEASVDGRTISFEEGSGFGWRDTPFSLEVTDEEALLKSIRRAGLMRTLVTWQPKIDLNRIKQDPEIRQKLSGIRYGNKTQFRIEPAETDERLEAIAGVPDPVWEIKRPRSRVVA